MESRKMVPKNLFNRATVEKQTQRTDLWTWGEGRGGEDETYRKNNMETCITICKIDTQWEFAVCLRKLKQGLCINLEWWDGREFQKEEDVCIPMADSY